MTDFYLAPCHRVFSSVRLYDALWLPSDIPKSTPREISTSKCPRRSVMIRVPSELHARLARLAAEILAAKEEARGYDDIPLAEQGERGIWVPIYAVIERALDEFENHRMRSNPRPTHDKQQNK